MPKIVSLQNVSLKFGKVAVLNDVEIAVQSGDVMLIRGSNGSGKSTLLRVLASALRADSGERVGPPTCAFVPPFVGQMPITPRTWLSHMSPTARARQDRLLTELGFAGDLDSAWDHLSFGNQRKVLIAEAFSSTETLVLIDEPSSGLDSAGITALQRIITEASLDGKAVILSEQDGHLETFGNREVRLQGGKLVAKDTEQLCTMSLQGPEGNRNHALSAAAKFGFFEAPSQ